MISTVTLLADMECQEDLAGMEVTKVGWEETGDNLDRAMAKDSEARVSIRVGQEGSNNNGDNSNKVGDIRVNNHGDSLKVHMSKTSGEETQVVLGSHNTWAVLVRSRIGGAWEGWEGWEEWEVQSVDNRIGSIRIQSCR